MKIQPLSNLPHSEKTQASQRPLKRPHSDSNFADQLRRAQKQPAADESLSRSKELRWQDLQNVLTETERAALEKLYRSEDELACYDSRCRKQAAFPIGRKIDFTA